MDHLTTCLKKTRGRTTDGHACRAETAAWDPSGLKIEPRSGLVDVLEPTLTQRESRLLSFRQHRYPNFIAEGNNQIDGNTENLLNLIRPYIGYGPIDMNKTVFKSYYNSLRKSLQKQFTSDSLINVNDTWSKNLTNASGQYNPEPQNNYDLLAEYSTSQYDERNVFNADFVYHVPYFVNQQRLKGRTPGGWEVPGIVTAGSGFYATPADYEF
jgi:hypothetical protein